VKRADLIRVPAEFGCTLIRHGRILGNLPREPCLYLVNRSGEEWHDPMIRSTCGDVVRIPALVEGQSIRLSLAPRSGCKYEIRYGTVDGDELLRLIEFSRKERADVEIVNDFHGCAEPDLTTRYRTWWPAD
jgi:hypothetical protein